MGTYPCSTDIQASFKVLASTHDTVVMRPWRKFLAHFTRRSTILTQSIGHALVFRWPVFDVASWRIRPFGMATSRAQRVGEVCCTRLDIIIIWWGSVGEITCRLDGLDERDECGELEEKRCETSVWRHHVSVFVRNLQKEWQRSWIHEGAGCGVARVFGVSTTLSDPMRLSALLVSSLHANLMHAMLSCNITCIIRCCRPKQMPIALFAHFCPPSFAECRIRLPNAL